MAICSDYIALTVRELDGYLRQSARPVQSAPTDVRACLNDALTILGPRLESAGVTIEGPGPGVAAVEGVDVIPGLSPTPNASAPDLFPHEANVAVVGEGPWESGNLLSGNQLRQGEPTGPVAGASRLFAMADRRLLVHALVNLLKNAVEAATTTGRPPRIRLDIRPENQVLVISVADNGPGISTASVRHLFEVGYSTKGAGRGRGLPIVRESIESQGGRIEVESRPDAGAVFSIVLPRAEVHNQRPD